MGNPRGLATVGGESGVDCCGCFELFAVAVNFAPRRLGRPPGERSCDGGWRVGR
jgi:hypothetical protein